MKCPKCHTDNSPDSRYCSRCAAPLAPDGEEFINKTETLRPAKDDLEVGSLFADKYRIMKELGRGGMGVVYEAEDLKLKRTVALKFLPMELTYDVKARERFIHEAQAASALDHPHICTIHEIGETENGQMYIAMACYRGESLRAKIKRGPLRVKDAVACAVQVADGMAKAHEQSIVHRDIKPANIIVTEDGIAKIVDFGLAKLTGEARLTRPSTVVGTVAYMSPEQAKGETVDARSDVWSLGVVLYEMITGTLPFEGETEQSYLYSILRKNPKPVKDLPAGVPLEYGEIVRKALAKNPDRRFRSGKEIAEALHGLQQKMAAESYVKTRKLVFQRPLKRFLVGAGAAVVLIAAALTIWLSSRPGLAFENRDKLLVADVENQTGDQVFDLALKTAIEADLQQSTYANVYDRSQVADTLRMMRRAPSSRIDEQVGLEICRFAGVRALILPRILSVGEAFELQAIVVDPVSKRVVDRIRLTARGREQVLLEAIDNLARRLRSRLGESLKSIEKSDKPIAQVATSSWEALNYFSMGQAKRQDGKFKDSATFLEMALDKDPHFVAARNALGLLLIEHLGQKDKGKETLRQALKDAEAQGGTQLELRIAKVLNRHYVDEDMPGALEEYRLIRELYPDYMPAYNNPGLILRRLGRVDEAIGMFNKAAEIAPRNSLPPSNLWFTYMNWKKDAVAGEGIGRKLVQFAPGNVWSHHFLGYSLAAQGRFEEAEKEFRKSLEIEPEHPYDLDNIGHVLYAMGRAREAIPFYRKVLDLTRQGQANGTIEGDSLSLISALKSSGDVAAAKQLASEIRESILKRTAAAPLKPDDLVVLGKIEAIIGRPSEADRYLRQILGQGPKDPGSLMEIAQMYSLLGQKELAISTLKKSFDAGYRDYFYPVILPAFQAIRADPQFRAIFGIDKVVADKKSEKSI
jgi:serine/threonine protein kinase/Flp pilus assembly protein TadD